MFPCDRHLLLSARRGPLCRGRSFTSPGGPMDVLGEMMAGPIGGCVNQLLEADVHQPASTYLFG